MERFFFVALRPDVGSCPHFYGALRSHLLDTTQFVVYSGRVISPTQLPLPDNTQHTTHNHPCPGGFSVIQRPQLHPLDRTATEIGTCNELVR
jgi:hypothetical protein